MQIQEETMLSRINELTRQKNNFKKQLEETVSTLKKKNNQLILLEDDKEEKELKLDGIQRERQPQKGEDVEKFKKPKSFKQTGDLIDIRIQEKKSQEERALKKQTEEALQGLDFTNDYKLKIVTAKRKSCFDYIQVGFEKIVQFVTPFENQIKVIQGTQSEAIQTLFVFV